MRQELDATTLLDAGLVPLEDAAAALGIEPKRLRGFIFRNDLRDPIGGWKDGGMAVYGWSCRELAQASTSSVAVGP